MKLKRKTVAERVWIKMAQKVKKKWSPFFLLPKNFINGQKGLQYFHNKTIANGIPIIQFDLL